MDGLLDCNDCLPGEPKFDTGQRQSVVRIRPVFSDQNSLFELLLGLGMLAIFLVVAGQVKDGGRVLWVQFQCLLVALQR